MKVADVTKKWTGVCRSSGEIAQNVLKGWKLVVQNAMYLLRINNFCFDLYPFREKQVGCRGGWVVHQGAWCTRGVQEAQTTAGIWLRWKKEGEEDVASIIDRKL